MINVSLVDNNFLRMYGVRFEKEKIEKRKSEKNNYLGNLGLIYMNFWLVNFLFLIIYISFFNPRGSHMQRSKIKFKI